MKRWAFVFTCLALLCLNLSPATADPINIWALFQTVHSEISGNRARDYVMRLWMYDKWSTLPGWKKASRKPRPSCRSGDSTRR